MGCLRSRCGALQLFGPPPRHEPLAQTRLANRALEIFWASKRRRFGLEPTCRNARAGSEQFTVTNNATSLGRKSGHTKTCASGIDSGAVAADWSAVVAFAEFDTAAPCISSFQQKRDYWCARCNSNDPPPSRSPVANHLEVSRLLVPGLPGARGGAC